MKEIFGDLFDQTDADAICITTNGFVKRDGSCVMGRGCAKEANRRWNCAKRLGGYIRFLGNEPCVLIFKNPFSETFAHSSKGEDFPGVKVKELIPYDVVSFPVKHNWWEKADINLIKNSAERLVNLATHHKWKKVILPRPGCGNGKLDWNDVKPILESILDNRFYVIDLEERGQKDWDHARDAYGGEADYSGM